MLSFRFPVAVAGLALLSFGALAQPRSNLFVLPQAGQGDVISILNANPFSLLPNATTAADAKHIFLNSAGTRAFVVSAQGAVSVLDATDGFRQLQIYSLGGQQVKDATLTPDGRKLLVLTTRLRVIDTAFDLPPSIPTVDVGAVPDSIGVSFDSRRAYVSSGVSRTLVAVDLDTNQTIAQQGITGTPGGVAVGPNGLIYLAASNVLYEFDWRDGFVATVPGGFSFVGEPSKPIFTPDGRYVVFATRPNDSASTVIQFEVATRTVTSVTGPANLTGLVTVSNSRAFGVADGIVNAINIGPLQPPGPAPIGALAGTLALSASDESPTARFLFGQTSNTVYRSDLVNNLFAGPLSTIGPAESVFFRATPSANTPAALQRTMSPAPIAPSATSFPIAVRAVDASGRPVPNVLVQYTTTAAGLQIPVNSARTNNDGLAAVSAIAPSVAGAYIVRATSAGGFVDIPIDVTSAPITESRFSIFSGQGQVVTAGSTAVAFQVRLRDAVGTPVAGETVNWTVASGLGVTVVTPSSTTDAAGVATGLFSTSSFPASVTEQFRPFSVQAAVATGTLAATQILSAVALPAGANVNVQLTNNLQATGGIFLLPAGGTLDRAFEALVFTIPPAGLGLVPVPLPNVGIRAQIVDSGLLQARCNDNPVTSAAGAVACNLAVGPDLGNGTLNIIVGELASQTFAQPVSVIPGAPASLRIVQGNGQSGGPGEVTPLALVVEVRDSAGNALRNVGIAWTILTGSAELVNPRFNTDNNGRASTQVRFGTLPGTVTVRALTGALGTNFTLTNTASGGVLVTAESGNGQTVQVNQPFPAPLVAKVTSGAGTPLPGTIVNFTSTGPAILSATSATTNAQGLASITAVAGGTAGAVTVTANFSGIAAVFNLNVTPTGPRIDSLLNGASFQPGASPCAIGVVRGRFGIPANSIVSASVGAIPMLAFTLSGVSVQIGGQAAPLYYVSNIAGEEQLGIQIPCEQPVGPKEMRVTAQGASSTFPITLTDVAPGIFESQMTPGLVQGVALRPNGTYVSPGNPARHNEAITGYFTGLGATTDARGTNIPGIGQPLPLDRLILGVNSRGMPVLSASYAPNLIGVWVVTFRVTSEAGEGDRQAYAIGVRNFEGNVIYGQPSSMAVRAQ